MSNQRYLLKESEQAEHLGITLPLSLPVQPDTNAAMDSGMPDARVLYITLSQYGKDWHSMVHSHTFSEMFYVTKGSGRLRCGKSTFPLQKNDLVIINPNIEHAEFSQEDDPLEYIVLGIEGITFSASYADTTPDALYFLREAQSIGNYIRLLLDEAQAKADSYKIVCQNLINVIIALLHRQQNMTVVPFTASYVLPFCATAKDYIDSHFKEAIDLDTLAHIAGQNKFYLAHSFTDTYGMSPMRYLMKRKIDESLHLLSDTAMPVYVISGILGFSSSSHFAQAFRRITGVTPNVYRKKFRVSTGKTPG